MANELCLPPERRSTPSSATWAEAARPGRWRRATAPFGRLIPRQIPGLASPSGQLLVRAAWITAFSLCVKLAALVKDISVARAFGAGAELDCFLVAFTLPLVVWSVTAQSLSIAFLPSLVRVRQHSGQATANVLIRVMLTRVVVGFTLVAGVMTLLSPWLLPLVASGFDDQELALTGRLFGILVWAIPLTGISGYLGAILNASESFVVVAIAPITLPLAMFLSVVILVPHYGIEALAWSVVVSYVLELAVLCATMWWHDLPLLPTWQRHEALGHVMRQYGHLFVGAMLMSSTTLVDQSMATWLGPGSVSVLNYGNKVVALLVGTIALGLGTAVFPHFSRLAASGDTPAIRKTLRSLVIIVTAVTIPLTGLLMLFSRPVAELLFHRGAVTPETISTIAQVQFCYLLQVPAYVAGTLGVRMLLALGGAGRSVELPA